MLIKERAFADPIIVIHENGITMMYGRLRFKQCVSTHSLSLVSLARIYSVGLSHENPGSLYSCRGKYLFVFHEVQSPQIPVCMLPCVPLQARINVIYTATARVYRWLVVLLTATSLFLYIYSY